MTEGSSSDTGERSLRDRAVERIKKKSEFRTHVLAYVLVNGFLVAIWAISGPDNFLLADLLDPRLGHRPGLPRVGHLSRRRADRGTDPTRDGPIAEAALASGRTTG
jgi:hypothetical protein